VDTSLVPVAGAAETAPASPDQTLPAGAPPLLSGLPAPSEPAPSEGGVPLAR